MTTVPRTLDEVLQSTSDALFPDELGERRIEMGTHGTEGDTPLHVAAWRSDVEAVEILVTAGADVNALGDMNESPLHVAFHTRNARIAAVLLRAGARDDIRGEFGLTPREMAMEYPELATLFQTIR